MNILPEFSLPALSLPQSVNDLVALAQRYGWNRSLPPGLDLGDGQQLDAADVLDGHFFRLSETHDATSSPLPCYAYVRSDLGIAIASLAPHLTPLVDLAEEVAQTVPPTHPSPQFRADLQRALEREHQQQIAKRILVAQPQAPASLALSQRLRSKPALMAGLPLLLGLLACIAWYQRDTKFFFLFSRFQTAQS